ncbi:MAG: aldehyde reductase [Bacteroidota bacterium]
MNSSKTVLVTGGSGFLGAHCVHQLMEQGHHVKTTIRSAKRENEILDALQKAGLADLSKLQFVHADLNKDDNWDQAVQDCDYVLHVASPFPASQPKDENELIRPAVEGTRRVLNAARQAGVKRVVLTSSFAAIGYGSQDLSKVLSEADWTDPNSDISAYVKSKTLAERAAWDFIKADDSGMELTVINPRFILGPSLGGRATTSLSVMTQLFDGSMKRVPDVSYGIIDVRDVADLHVKAMTHPKAAGERFLACSGDPITFHEMALLIRERYGEQASQVTTKVYPNWLLRAVALFNPVARGVVPNLGKMIYSKNDKATQLMGWQPRSREAAILASIESILLSRS